MPEKPLNTFKDFQESLRLSELAEILKRKLISDEADFKEEYENENDTVLPRTATLKHVEKIGRNDPCSCGSGKKYKKCCGRAF